MFTVATPEELRRELKNRRQGGVGFVPTMGYLHEGHLSLVKSARSTCSTVVASIFVNPTQFNNSEDLAKYPRDTERDLALLAEAGIDGVFLPTPETIYGPGFQSWVTVDEVTKPLEGACRPGHFRGVTTVVNILFNIVQPDKAVFGEKDFQQLRTIEQMVTDLKMPIEIVRGPTVRESDGLAMSSRNVRLGPSARQQAVALSRGLRLAAQQARSGETRGSELIAVVTNELQREPEIKPEYITLVDEETLAEIAILGSRPARILVAAWVGGVRLIDNIAVGR